MNEATIAIDWIQRVVERLVQLNTDFDVDDIQVSWSNRNFIEEPIQVLSLGGGTQSTAMLLMIAEGSLPKPDLVIFADTGSEMPYTIDHIENVCKPFIRDVLEIPFFVARSHRGALHEDYMSKKSIPIPGVRSCTGNFKIDPQRRVVRAIVGNKRGKKLCDFWLGITTDEARRRPAAKDPREPKWVDLSYPLLDDLPTSREECIAINERFEWEVVKSGCFCCPYSSSQTWRDLREQFPELFAIAVEMERVKNEHRPGKYGLHRERPLSTIDDWDLPESPCDSGGGCFI